MPDGSDTQTSEQNLERELMPVELINRQLMFGLDRLVENGELDEAGVKRVVSALETLSPEARDLILQQMTHCIGQGTGLMPLIEPLLKPAPEPVRHVSPPHGHNEDAHK